MDNEASGVVLAGAAALGAYEAGVLDHVMGAVAREIGRPNLFEVISGTSAGAINAAALATYIDDPKVATARLCATWAGLQLGRVIRPSALEILWLLLDVGGAPSRLWRAMRIRRARGGLLDPSPIVELLTRELPIGRLQANLAAHRLRGIAIVTTHVGTGRATVFYQTARPGSRWVGDASMDPVNARIGIVHAVASAAIPLLFPPVLIDGDLYCDGGLRQMVPLSPSIHLGARRLLVVNPLAQTPRFDTADPAVQQARRDAATSPLYLAGKALNALFADRTEVDLARLEQLTGVLRAGRRRYGPAFEAEINHELARAGALPLREITALRIDPSRELGQLAAEYATSAAFAKRERGAVGRVLQCIAERGEVRGGDLLSYLLFDGGFASELIALGRADARARHSELCEFFATETAPTATPLVAGGR